MMNKRKRSKKCFAVGRLCRLDVTAVLTLPVIASRHARDPAAIGRGVGEWGGGQWVLSDYELLESSTTPKIKQPFQFVHFICMVGEDHFALRRAVTRSRPTTVWTSSLIVFCRPWLGPVVV